MFVKNDKRFSVRLSFCGSLTAGLNYLKLFQFKNFRELLVIWSLHSYYPKNSEMCFVFVFKFSLLLLLVSPTSYFGDLR